MANNKTNSNKKETKGRSKQTKSKSSTKKNTSSKRTTRPRKPSVPLRIAFLGGINEVGKNITLYECGDDMFIVDCGMLFPEPELLGVDFVIPDFTYIERNADKIRGVVLTHGHEDHIGGLPYLLKTLNVPVYGTKFTLGLLEGKLREHELLRSTSLNVVKPGDTVSLGCFDIEFIKVNHSIPDSVALAIKSPAGVVVQTGDFKVDTTPIEVTEDEIETDYIDYTFPPIDLLDKAKEPSGGQDRPEDLRTQAKKLVETLQSFGVEAKVLEVSKGPSVTRFELQPSAGVKVSKIVNLADDIALNLAAFGVRIEAPIPGKAAVGIEIPNKSTSMVALRDVIDSDEFKNFNSKTAFAMGKDISGQPIVSDISKMPHMLIAGATGSGKSVCINSLITSILYKADPNEVKLILIDPKVVELSVYNGIPHLLIPVVTDPRRAAGALNWAVQEMVKRYSMFATANVRDIKGYNEYAALSGDRQLEQIIIVIDELADLMMVSPHEVEDSICRLAQMARAAGMHLVIATQRPSVDVITGLIKANVPSRIAFSVSSQIDSRTILDMGGAEKLLGKGDMLFLPMGASKPTRLQGAFVSDKEIEKIVEFVKTDFSAHYNEDVIEHIENGVDERAGGDDSDADDLLPQAMEIVVELGQASASLLQRKLKVGYSRAGRLIDQLEERGVIGPHEGSKPRKVIMSRNEFHEMMLNNGDD